MAITLLSLLFTSNVIADQERPVFKNPPEISSQDGKLDTTLTVDWSKVEAGGKKFESYVYNGLFIPPTLRLKPGETLNLELYNKKDGPTNLHFHGTNTSPKGNSDNVFLTIPPGDKLYYSVFFPEIHPQGLFWYHPHIHGTTEYQIGGGMSGLISVDGLLDPWPELQGITTRVMLLRDVQLDKGKVPNPPDPGNPTMRMINGMVNPTIDIKEGEVQLWRVGNIGA
ncbi:MAG: multicopper oxidase domain-containing protein, partial [Pseudomonadota bacterium]